MVFSHATVLLMKGRNSHGLFIDTDNPPTQLPVAMTENVMQGDSGSEEGVELWLR